MKDTWLVLQTEFSRKIRSRIFLIATVGGAIGIMSLVLAPILFANVAKTQTNALVVAGPPAVRARVTEALKSQFDVVASLDTLPATIDYRFLDDHGHAAAAISVSIRNRRLHVDVYPRDLTAFEDVQFRALIPYNTELATGIASDRAETFGRIDKTLHGIDHKFRTTSQATVGHAFAFGLIFLLYFAIVLASQTVMSAVAEEKTSRIAEILVATISPVDLLTGKTFAAAALAVVQIVVWGIAALVALPITALSIGGRGALDLAPSATQAATAPPPPSVVSAALGALDVWSLLAFAIFFALGYLQYATLYAAAASLVSRTEDLGSVTTPIILPAVIAFLFAQYAILSPDNALVVASSFIPLVSPFVMFARIAVASVPVWQVVLALLVNFLTVALSFIAAGKIYRVGMLLTGKLPSPKQILAALRS